MNASKDFRTSRVLSSPNRFKLAAFGFNSQGGSTITSAPGTADTDWPMQVRIAQLAERAGLEAIIPGARWRGYGGATNFQGRSYETLSWAAGLSALTSIIQVFATVHFTTIHPVRLAKTLTTIDHISGGRLGVNWVAGWNVEEITMFGGVQRDHDERYEYAEEYLSLLNQLLQKSEDFSFKGRYFDLEHLYSEPKPLQTPRPVYMAAGLSPRGRQFAGSHADINFTPTHLGPEAMAGLITDTKGKAREFGRDVLVFGQSVIVCADTEQEAKDYFEYYVNEKGDFEAGRNLIRQLFGETRDASGAKRGAMPEHVMKGILKNAVAGHGGATLVGTPTQVVEALVRQADSGMDGSTISWVNFEEGLKQFHDKILPIMIQAGLRVDEKLDQPKQPHQPE